MNFCNKGRRSSTAETGCVAKAAPIAVILTSRFKASPSHSHRRRPRRAGRTDTVARIGRDRRFSPYDCTARQGRGQRRKGQGEQRHRTVVHPVPARLPLAHPA